MAELLSNRDFAGYHLYELLYDTSAVTGYRAQSVGSNVACIFEVIKKTSKDLDEVQHLNNILNRNKTVKKGRPSGYVNIATVLHSVGLPASQKIPFAYLILELNSDSCLLGEYMKKNKISSQDAMQLCLQILNGLQCAHSQNLLHGNLHAKNLMIRQLDNKIKIQNFGIFCWQQKQQPKVADDLRDTALIYYAMRKNLPFDEAGMQELRQQTDFHDKVLSASEQNFIRNAISGHYASAEEMLRDLEKLCISDPVIGIPDTADKAEAETIINKVSSPVSSPQPQKKKNPSPSPAPSPVSVPNLKNTEDAYEKSIIEATIKRAEQLRLEDSMQEKKQEAQPENYYCMMDTRYRPSPGEHDVYPSKEEYQRLCNLQINNDGSEPKDGDFLGYGSFSAVCYRKRGSRKIAQKIYKLTELQPNDRYELLEHAKREIESFQKMNGHYMISAAFYPEYSTPLERIQAEIEKMKGNTAGLPAENLDYIFIEMEFGLSYYNYISWLWQSANYTSHVLKAVRDLFISLSEMHRIITHSDIKPKNIILVQRYERLQPAFIDFNISHIIRGESSNSATTFTVVGGSRDYMPYEVLHHIISKEKGKFRGNDKIDVYSMGMIAYVMLDDGNYYKTKKIKWEKIPKPSNYDRLGLSSEKAEDFFYYLCQCLHTKSSKRPSAAEMADAICYVTFPEENLLSGKKKKEEEEAKKAYLKLEQKKIQSVLQQLKNPAPAEQSAPRQCPERKYAPSDARQTSGYPNLAEYQRLCSLEFKNSIQPIQDNDILVLDQYNALCCRIRNGQKTVQRICAVGRMPTEQQQEFLTSLLQKLACCRKLELEQHSSVVRTYWEYSTSPEEIKQALEGRISLDYVVTETEYGLSYTAYLQWLCQSEFYKDYLLDSIRDLFDALEELHDSMPHGCLCPENIFLLKRGGRLRPAFTGITGEGSCDLDIYYMGNIVYLMLDGGGILWDNIPGMTKPPSNCTKLGLNTLKSGKLKKLVSLCRSDKPNERPSAKFMHNQICTLCCTGRP